MRRVVFYTDASDFGGAEMALLQLLGGLDRARFDPLLLHEDNPGIRPLVDGVRELGVRRVVVPPMPMGLAGARRIPAFARLLRRERAHVFHAIMSWPLACRHALIGAAVARVPLIVAHVQLFIDLPYARSDRLKVRVLATGVHRVIGVSRQTAARMGEVFAIPPKRLRVVPNAAPVERLAGIPAFAGCFHQPPRVLTLARLEKQKGIPYLLDVASRVPEASFAIAGDGPDRAALEMRARELGIADRVTFLGRRSDVPELLAATDVFMLPSLYEGLPLTVLEAMAAGRPVIATAAGGTGEVVIDGETGLLVPPADPAALAAALRRLLADPAEAVRLAATARDRVQRDYGIDVMVRRIESIYDEVRGGR